MKSICFSLLMVVCFQVKASDTISSNIKSLWVNDLGAEVVYLELESRFQSTCNTAGSRYFIIHLDRKNMREAYSMALAAFMSDKKVNVGGANECSGANEVLRYIYLSK